MHIQMYACGPNNVKINAPVVRAHHTTSVGVSLSLDRSLMVSWQHRRHWEWFDDNAIAHISGISLLPLHPSPASICAGSERCPVSFAYDQAVAAVAMALYCLGSCLGSCHWQHRRLVGVARGMDGSGDDSYFAKGSGSGRVDSERLNCPCQYADWRSLESRLP